MQLICKFDRIQEDTESKIIIELWENLIPTIYDLSENETYAATVSMLMHGADDFSEGTFTKVEYD